MCGNGVPTGTQILITKPAQPTIPKAQLRAAIVLCGAVRGASVRQAVARPTAATTHPPTVASTTVFGSPRTFKLYYF